MMRQRYSCGWLKRVAAAERKVPTTAVTSSLAGATMVSLLLQRLCEHPDRLSGSVKFSLDTVTLASSVVSISPFEACPTCSRFHHGCHRYRVRRQIFNIELTERVRNPDFMVFLSEPVVLDCRCNLCGRKTDYFELAAKFDERISECVACGQRSNMPRIVDALPFHELLDAFAGRPLPVKFVYFHERDQQFLFELED
jgi:molybdopterin-synthase adenylyltransferase